ncbi:UDP-N-acetylglucosamine 2-epimerase [Thiomicrorhabdus sp.]|uniref:UDP-N-acetylglucosamine 2-epimerase n=1 Tax=Thiomicrorhabdus sp. TaxID=2039724 RepID=UPI0029C82A39|nr:UDP-N-acetylglucosamine 2-epimerase [Thiomicrorhabdus sp.]
MNPKKICVVTGTRAEYGLLYQTLRELQAHPNAELQLVVCAAHLSEQFGMTVQQIETDGFEISARVETLNPLDDQDPQKQVALSVARGIGSFAEAFRRLQPDVILLLGDRYEIFAAAQTALFLHYPLAHIHGGEVTSGAIDDALRHAITKMAHLHFVAAEPYRKRVIQLGELPERVFNVGAPGLDLISRIDYRNRQQLSNDLQLDLGDEKTPIFLVTYHPVTWGESSGIEAVHNLFAALEAFPQARIIWTGSNADAQGAQLQTLINDWASATDLHVKTVSSLGSQRYLSLMKVATLVLGNSSSGIIEAPAMGTATVNIGSRQDGRLKAPSVIDCSESPKAITEAITLAMGDAHQAVSKTRPSLYGQGDSAHLIVETLLSADLKKLTNKPFYDLVE